jgi:hypothetical protein
MANGKTKKVTSTKLPTRSENNDRIAQKILTRMIVPANLQLEDAVEAVALVLKALVLSNSSEEEPMDRSDLIAWIEGHVLDVLDEIDPCGPDFEEPPPHFWIVPPQGLITETIGVLWDGSVGEQATDVKVVTGEDLSVIHAECLKTREETGLVIVEGVEGIAIIDPDWDGKATTTCPNPACGKEHDVHLMVAENLYLQTVGQKAVSN